MIENFKMVSDKVRLAGSRENGSSKKAGNESDVSVYRALDLIGDHDFCTKFQVPPGKVDLFNVYLMLSEFIFTVLTYYISCQVDKPCQLGVACYRTPIYIGGRYLKVYC